jgi:hypothetical protein
VSDGDYSFDIEGIGRMYCRGGTDRTPLNDHVVLKLMSALVAQESLEYEPEDFHRKYSPDAVSEDGKRWFECGRNNASKVKDIVLERKVDEIVFHRFQNRGVDGLWPPTDQVGILVDKAKIRRPRISLYLWQGADVETLRENLARHSDIKDVTVERDGDRIDVSLTLNGHPLTAKGRLKTWEPTERKR